MGHSKLVTTKEMTERRVERKREQEGGPESWRKSSVASIPKLNLITKR